ncbi:hypothetical protein [uncultured Rikenella sp.]|uniref:hypothetical protein n=1 Tax=uncultured Rikenella sp. TaxID=368003 RepID=UPI0026067FC1|nr:hypothetical protein [uncultured Rikenella sp.]
MKKLLLLCIVMLFSGLAFAQTKKVAVYVEGEIGNDDKSIISSATLARMSGNKEYAPFERNEAFVDALTAEQDYQLSGEVPEKEIRKVGERLGVDYVIVVNVVIKRDETCFMSARLINLETGAIVKTVNQNRKYTDSSVLTALANNVAYRLLNKRSK